MRASYVSLHTHSEFSPLDGLAQLPALVNAAVSDNQPALAISDHGTLGGVWKFDKLARDAGLKPIIALEAYLAYGNRFVHDTAPTDPDDEDAVAGGKSAQDKKYMHITLVAATKQGWRNLVAISNESHNSYWSKPRIDLDLLRTHSDGLIILTGCLGGPLAYHLNRAVLAEARGDMKAAEELRGTARWYVDEFTSMVGIERVFIEVMAHGIPGEERVTQDLVRLSSETGARLVATNDSHYVSADQAGAHEAWLSVSSGSLLSDPNRFKFHGSGFHLRTEAEMRELIEDEWWQEAVSNTVIVADMVEERVLPEERLRLPVFTPPDGFDTSTDYLHYLVIRGAIRRYAPDMPIDSPSSILPDAVRERLSREFNVIVSLGFVDYFLIVADILAWARQQNIPVNKGRGSSSGSVVAYALRIVDIDPLEHGLLFERFLDPTRGDLPDVDMDFGKARIDEVYSYTVGKYGADKVARLGSWGMCRTKAAIKDAARVLGLRRLGEQLTKGIPNGATGKPSAFVDYNNADARNVLALADQFNGTVRQPSKHSCGVVLSSEPLTDMVPLRADRVEAGAPPITEWDEYDIASLGLVKMDFLAIRSLDIAAACAEMVEANTGEHIDLDEIDPIRPAHPDRAAATWAMLSAGHTAGVFQMESEGISTLLRQVAPEDIDALSAVNALYRPGPMEGDMHNRYARRRQAIEPVDYSYLTRDPDETAVIAHTLDATLGVIIYQEQLMALGESVAGFDPVWTSRLRRAVSKKKKSEVDVVHEAFIAGGTSSTSMSGVAKIAFDETTLEKLWTTFRGSAKYLFNKSHAVAYAYLAYTTAYLKANWPSEFAAAMLTTMGETKDAGKRSGILTYLQREGIRVAPPDVNKGGASTTCGGGVVRLGMSEVKHVGEAAGAIVAEREANGPYTSLADFRCRVKKLSIRAVESLIQAGALDEFGSRMGLMMIARAVKTTGKDDRVDLPVPDNQWGVLEEAARQRCVLGYSLGTHPLLVLGEQVEQWRAPNRARVIPLEHLGKCVGEMNVNTVGILTAWTPGTYSKGKLANFTLEGVTQRVTGVAFDATMRKVEEHFGSAGPPLGSIVAMCGKVSEDSRSTSDDASGHFEIVAWDVWDVPVLDTPLMPGDLLRNSQAGVTVSHALTSEDRDTDIVAGTLTPSRVPATQNCGDEREYGPPDGAWDEINDIYENQSPPGLPGPVTPPPKTPPAPKSPPTPVPVMDDAQVIDLPATPVLECPEGVDAIVRVELETSNPCDFAELLAIRPFSMGAFFGEGVSAPPQHWSSREGVWAVETGEVYMLVVVGGYDPSVGITPFDTAGVTSGSYTRYAPGWWLISGLDAKDSEGDSPSGVADIA